MRFFTFLLLLVFISCSGDPAAVEQRVTFTENSIHNEDLGFKLSVPEAWRVISGEELTERQAVSAEEMRSKISDLGTRRSVFEPFLALEPYASEDSSYVTLLFMSERLEDVPGINNAYDYFNQNQSILQGQDPDAYPRYEFSMIRNVQLAGKAAISQGVIIHPNEEELQPMESTVIKRGDYLLVIQVANFDSVEELAMAKEVMNAITWQD